MKTKLFRKDEAKFSNVVGVINWL